MRKIIRIEHIEERKDSKGKTFFRTHAILEDGSEVVGYGKDFDLGDLVESFWHYNQAKMRKPVDKPIA